MADLKYTDAYLRDILESTKVIALVGCSPRQNKASYIAARYLQLKGYRVIPVNPMYVGQEILGEPVYASLTEIPDDIGAIDMVDIFRNSVAAGEITDEAISVLSSRGLAVVWMQISVVNQEAAQRAETAGFKVVMNRCPKIEYSRLNGELRWGGFNTGIISSKLTL